MPWRALTSDTLREMTAEFTGSAPNGTTNQNDVRYDGLRRSFASGR